MSNRVGPEESCEESSSRSTHRQRRVANGGDGVRAAHLLSADDHREDVDTPGGDSARSGLEPRSHCQLSLHSFLPAAGEANFDQRCEQPIFLQNDGLEIQLGEAEFHRLQHPAIANTNHRPRKQSCTSCRAAHHKHNCGADPSCSYGRAARAVGDDHAESAASTRQAAAAPVRSTAREQAAPMPQG